MKIKYVNQIINKDVFSLFCYSVIDEKLDDEQLLIKTPFENFPKEIYNVHHFEQL